MKNSVRHKDYIVYDGNIYAVFTYRMEHTVLGTVWRFIMDNRATLVLVPIQTPKNPPAQPGVVPLDVNSVLSALARLAFGVLGAYMPQPGTKEYDDVPLHEYGKYASQKLAKQDKAAEKEAFGLIQIQNARWKGKKLSVANLTKIRELLFEAALRHENDPSIPHSSLTATLIMWKDITGYEPSECIMLSYAEKMSKTIMEFARRTAKAENITVEKARRLVLDQIRYVGELGADTTDGYPNRTFVLLQDARLTVHNKEDTEVFHLVAPTEAEREAIEVETEKRRIRGVSERTVLPEVLAPSVRLAKAWQMLSIFNLSQSAWETIRKTYPPSGNKGTCKTWDVDEMMRSTGAGLRTSLSGKEIDKILLSTSPADLEKQHPELKIHIKKTSGK